jgi:tetrapyrrole methylase family protein/MazG family protein
MPTVTVVGLGPAGPDLLTAGTLDALAACEHRFLRTTRHPAAVAVEGAASFDHVYEAASTIDDVYPAIVEALVAAAVAHGSVVYAVPGSPVVAERTVELLLADGRVRTVVLPALSFLDLAWARLGIDPIAVGARVVDGHRFEVEAAGERGPLLVAQCDSPDVLSAVKLAIGEALDTRSTLGSGLARRELDGEHVRGSGFLPDDLRVTVIQRLGLPDEQIVTVAWDDLDRDIQPDHLTSVWIPAYVAPVAFEVQRFAELVATLRRECPWDQEQTHESLKRHLLEESYEVIDALDGVDPETGEGYEHLEEELGDLLFQIIFHATLASEAGQFTLADVARGVHDKLHSRHPHVFGQADADDAEQVAANWEDIKKAEKGRSSVFDGIPDALPALLYALKVQKKAAALGVGSTIGAGTAGIDGAPVIASVDDALAAVRAASGGAGIDDGVGPDLVGELLFSVVDLARVAAVDPATALRSATLRHRDAVRLLEQGARTAPESGDADGAEQ